MSESKLFEITWVVRLSVHMVAAAKLGAPRSQLSFLQLILKYQLSCSTHRFHGMGTIFVSCLFGGGLVENLFRFFAAVAT